MEEAVASLAQLNPRRFQRLSQRMQVGGRQLPGSCRAHSLRSGGGDACRCQCKPHSPGSSNDESGIMYYEQESFRIALIAPS